MRRIYFTLFCLLIITATGGSLLAGSDTSHIVKQPRLEPETLNYDVMFKWGLINKKAGSATLSLFRGHDSFVSCLTAESAPWADRIYKVRDTLNGKMDFENFAPLFYEKIANESNDRKHDTVTYDYISCPGKTIANCTRKVWHNGIQNVDETKEMESDRLAMDMLTSFYFMRTLPFEHWQAGHTEIADIFSGKQKEVLSIVYRGLKNIEIKNKKYLTYHITFKFTSKGGTKTSDDMDAWIAADSSRIPIKLEGKLPVGKVHCIYVSQ